MKILILGASGATGSLVALELLRRNIQLRVIVREGATLPTVLSNNPLVEIQRGNIAEITNAALSGLLDNCSGVISCLGHNITLKGMFGRPRNLVADSIQQICQMIIRNNDFKVKLILMSTTAFTNARNNEKNSWGEKMILSILMHVLPPHRDNVAAATYLQNEIGAECPKIEWIAVRPDSLINESYAGLYEVWQFPVRSPVFNAGKVSRINVGQFMADLMTDEQAWQKWRYRMPVVYNKTVESR